MAWGDGEVSVGPLSVPTWQVVDALRSGPKSLSELLKATGRPMPTVSSALASLRKRGEVTHLRHVVWALADDEEER